MRIIEPHQLRAMQRRQNRRFPKILLGAAILVIFVFVAWAYLKPLPPIKSRPKTLTLSAKNVSIDWPTQGQAAIGTSELGVLKTHGTQKPVPIASVAKVVLALAILNQKPLQLNEQGPKITLDKQDVDYYNREIARVGSRVKVKAGEKITEYQALEALLLPSANNIADTLADWGFGSSAKYQDYANKMTASLGMNHTQINDASGFSPKTVSTAEDLVKRGNAAIQNPVIAQIVKKQQTRIPVEGTIRNVNSLLGEQGNIGVKTGDTDQAGGCFLFAYKNTVDNQEVTLIGAVVGARNLRQALSSAEPLASSTIDDFGLVTAVSKGQTVGYYDVPWQGKVNIVSKEDLAVFGWQGSSKKAKVAIKEFGDVQPGNSVGDVVVGRQRVDLTISSSIAKPGIVWRLKNVFEL